MQNIRCLENLLETFARAEILHVIRYYVKFCFRKCKQLLLCKVAGYNRSDTYDRYCKGWSVTFGTGVYKCSFGDPGRDLHNKNAVFRTPNGIYIVTGFTYDRCMMLDVAKFK